MEFHEPSVLDMYYRRGTQVRPLLGLESHNETSDEETEHTKKLSTKTAPTSTSSVKMNKFALRMARHMPNNEPASTSSRKSSYNDESDSSASHLSTH